MSDSRWEQIKEVFQSALERPSGAERERYLDAACGANAHFRAEVLDLLSSFDEADDFLDESPIAEVAEAIVGKQETISAGRKIGRYQIERKLGAGGMGEVFLARDTELERLVALKILSSVFSGNPDRVRRFMQEARAVSALNHPNILTIHEIGHYENVRFIATEYVEGKTLREQQHGDKPFDINEILDVFTQTSAALSAAHAANIVHRDIKPENIMIRRDKLVKVLDFGLAKLIENKPESENFKKSQIDTTPGMVMGTVAYMSPEQTRGLPTDARTDVWSLGICLSEIVFGVQPFAGETVSDQIAAILKSEPEFGSKNAPPALRRVIEKCLEKSVENRYQTVKDFSLDLKNFSKELVFSDETEFSFPSKNARDTQSNGRQTVEPALTTQSSLPPRSSSAEYVVGAIRKRKLLSFSAAGAAIAVLCLALYLSFFAGILRAKPIKSLAVLPFANESGNTGDEYLSDGLSESLINKLSQLPQLKVASRSAAFRYKGQNVESSEIAKSLGVEAIVMGSIVRRSDDLQINVELINAADNTQIWGENYRRKVADAQAVQEEITQTVLQKLRLRLSGADERRVSAPLTNNPQAYQLFLNGVFFRRKNGPENLRKAIEYQNQAIALDPEFALAYTELGNDYLTLVIINEIAPQTGMPPARQAIEKALSLNETLAEAHSVNADIKTSDFEWAAGESEIQRAIELNPNLAIAHTTYADLLSTLGRFDDAVREIRLAQQLDPLRINLVNLEGEFLLRARRYDEALATLDRAVPEAANETYALIHRARIYIAKGRYDEAFAALQKSLAAEKTDFGLIHLGRAYALTGNRQEALRILEELKKADGYVSPSEIAVLYTALDMREQAFAELEKASATRDLQVPLIKTAPEYDALRDDPRFDDLLRRINLSK